MIAGGSWSGRLVNSAIRRFSRSISLKAIRCTSRRSSTIRVWLGSMLACYGGETVGRPLAQAEAQGEAGAVPTRGTDPGRLKSHASAVRTISINYRFGVPARKWLLIICHQWEIGGT
jgi:hypothetical protein